MSQWPSAKAKRVLAALLKLGWQTKRQTGSHRTLSFVGWPDLVFAFHDGEEIGRACWRGLPGTQASLRKTYWANQAVAPNRPLHPTAFGVG